MLTKKRFGKTTLWWLVALGAVVLGAAIILLLWLQRHGSPFLPVALPGQEVVLWGQFENLSGNMLAITLQAPPNGFVGSTLPKKMFGSTLSLKVNPDAPYVAKYYRGDLIGGVEMLSEQKKISSLYPNTFLRITAKRQGWDEWVALEIIRPQIIPLPPPPVPGQSPARQAYPLISPP